MSGGPIYLSQRRDEAEPGIVKVFTSAGASVSKVQGKGLADLIVGLAGINHLVEVKSGSKAKLTPAQIEAYTSWQGEPVQICRNPDEALHLVKVWLTAAAVHLERKRKEGP
jgi:hypothetical protein